MGILGINELVILIVIIFPLVALIDIIGKTFIDGRNKVLWILLIIFLPILGTIWYFINRKQLKKAK